MDVCMIWSHLKHTLLGNDRISPFDGTFEDDFPLPQVGYVGSLEGIQNLLHVWFLQMPRHCNPPELHRIAITSLHRPCCRKRVKRLVISWRFCSLLMYPKVKSHDNFTPKVLTWNTPMKLNMSLWHTNQVQYVPMSLPGCCWRGRARKSEKIIYLSKILSGQLLWIFHQPSIISKCTSKSRGDVHTQSSWLILLWFQTPFESNVHQGKHLNQQKQNKSLFLPLRSSFRVPVAKQMWFGSMHIFRWTSP